MIININIVNDNNNNLISKIYGKFYVWNETFIIW